MEKNNYKNLHEQAEYGVLLEKLVNLGMIFLLVAFALYMTGYLEPLVPISELPEAWKLPLNDFIAQTGAPTGWSWLDHILTGDYLNFAGIAFLAGVTGICYLLLLVRFIQDGHKLYITVALIEIGLMVLAAANITGGGGH